MQKLPSVFILLAALLLQPVISSAQIRNFHTANLTIAANCDLCGELIEKAGSKKKEARVNWDAASKTLHIIYDSKKTTLDEVLKRLAYAGFDNAKFRAPDLAYNALPPCCQYPRAVQSGGALAHANHGEATPVSPDQDAHQDHGSEPGNATEPEKTSVPADPHKAHTTTPTPKADPHAGYPASPAKNSGTKQADPHVAHKAVPAKTPKVTDPHAGHKPVAAPTKTVAKPADPHAGHTTGKPVVKPAETARPAAPPAQSTDLMTDVYNQYFALKDALVKDDARTAAAKAGALEKAIVAVPMNKMSTTQHDVWMKLYKSLAADASRIAKESTVAKQRPHFASLSATMHQLSKEVKPAQKVYYQHCPMYNNNKGANWLSRERTIKNPYYGPAMLTCGRTLETIQ